MAPKIKPQRKLWDEKDAMKEAIKQFRKSKIFPQSVKYV
jgi:hypothetical protein